MHDPDTQATLVRIVLNEITKPRFGFAQCHSVQIDFGLYTEATSAQFPHCTSPDMLSMETQRTTGFVLEGVNIVFKAFCQHRLVVGSPKAGPRFRFGLFLRYASLDVERLGAGHRSSKHVLVVVSQNFGL